MSVAGAIIAAVAAAGGAIMNDQNAKKQRHIDARNRQIDQIKQDEYNRNGVQMKVDAARRAGIHPLYALGANTPQYSPASGGSAPVDNYLGDGLANAGQDISRAISASKTQEQKEIAALSLAGARLEVEGKALDNQYRAKQLQNLQATQPAFPGDQNQKLIPGQGNSPAITNKPMERSRTMPGRPDAEPGAVPSVGWSLNADGSLSPVPSKDVKERIEDNFIQETSWAIRNNLLPNFTGGNPPPGYEWSYDHQAYRKKGSYLGGGGPSRGFRPRKYKP